MQNVTTKPSGSNYETVWDGQANIPATFTDGQSNSILFAHKYARCEARGTGGTWWMRGVFHGLSASSGEPSTGGQQDSFPGDRLSAVFGGGRSRDEIILTGPASKFQVQPALPLNSAANGGKCDRRLASTPHAVMQAALADGSVRVISANVTPATWYAALTPGGGEVLGSDW